ncbi:hypothetical protein R6Q59_015128 [Mikania micrantha]
MGSSPVRDNLKDIQVREGILSLISGSGPMGGEGLPIPRGSRASGVAASYLCPVGPVKTTYVSRFMQEIGVHGVDMDRRDDAGICYDPESHSVELQSAVDILVATPGRLMDHTNNTKGFTLEHLCYMVVDETDRLLRESYQSWLPTVLQCTSSTVLSICSPG